MYEGGFRVQFQAIDLTLEFVRQPLVVRVEERDQ